MENELLPFGWRRLYANVITESIPTWLAQGHKELSDYRCIWDWFKYNVRARTIQYSKRKARERKEKEENLQEQYTPMQNVLSKQIQKCK